MGWLDRTPKAPSKLDVAEVPQMFTAEQVATAVAAAVEAHAAGDDPAEAAKAALT